MTTTHLKPAFKWCCLHLSVVSLPLCTVYNYTVICGYRVPAQTCQRHIMHYCVRLCNVIIYYGSAYFYCHITLGRNFTISKNEN